MSQATGPLQPAKKNRFYRRFLKALGFAFALLLGSLWVGILGYHYVAGFEWVDALLNASMILTGMGPVGTLTTTAAKVFASIYALFAGLMFITASGIILSPMFHRVLHRFHLDLDEKHDR